MNVPLRCASDEKYSSIIYVSGVSMYKNSRKVSAHAAPADIFALIGKERQEKENKKCEGNTQQLLN